MKNPVDLSKDRTLNFLTREALQSLLDLLITSNYQCLGPVKEDNIIQYRSISSINELPAGIVNHQSPGHYELEQTNKPYFFKWNHGPQALKPLCFAPKETLWTEKLNINGDISYDANIETPQRTAVLGVRACDIAALKIQDQHFLQKSEPDPHYQARRDNLLLIAIDCSTSANTCFCSSTGDGPAIQNNIDIGLSEISEGFLIWAGSETGKKLIAQLDTQTVTAEQIEQMNLSTHSAKEEQQRQLPNNIKHLLSNEKQNHKHWEDIAKRCLSCGNCTAVCPTCFCYSTDHEMSLDGLSAKNVRHWDSCFSSTHSGLGNFVIRTNTSQRYRQWMTHKLAGWFEQFGRSGCTGCGRCISWCPVGIDITEEAKQVLDND